MIFLKRSIDYVKTRYDLRPDQEQQASLEKTKNFPNQIQRKSRSKGKIKETKLNKKNQKKIETKTVNNKKNNEKANARLSIILKKSKDHDKTFDDENDQMIISDSSNEISEKFDSKKKSRTKIIKKGVAKIEEQPKLIDKEPERAQIIVENPGESLKTIIIDPKKKSENEFHPQNNLEKVVTHKQIELQKNLNLKTEIFAIQNHLTSKQIGNKNNEKKSSLTDKEQILLETLKKDSLNRKIQSQSVKNKNDATKIITDKVTLRQKSFKKLTPALLKSSDTESEEDVKANFIEKKYSHINSKRSGKNSKISRNKSWPEGEVKLNLDSKNLQSKYKMNIEESAESDVDKNQQQSHSQSNFDEESESLKSQDHLKTNEIYQESDESN